MIVIADTGLINYLVLIGEIELLPTLYGRIVVPPSVCGELKRPRAPEVVRLWIARPLAYLERRVPSQAPDAEILKARLGAGERDAILLAQELGADDLLIDDLRGRREAQRRHLHFTGTLGVLRAAAKVGLLDLRSAVESLRRTNFHIAQEILDRIMDSREGRSG